MTIQDAKRFLGQTIIAARLKDDELVMHLDDDRWVRLWDDGQSCCESRWITCDDDLSNIVGGAIIDVAEVDVAVPDNNDDDRYGEHDMMFVKIETTRGFITLCTHNDHNGYYGGFSVKIRLLNEV